MLRRLAGYARYRRTLRELRALDSAQLKDLGLTRYDIRTVARAASF